MKIRILKKLYISNRTLFRWFQDLLRKKKETEEAFTGSARGTAYHRVMECLEYNKTDSAQLLKRADRRTGSEQKMSEAEAECIRISDIQSFVNGTLGQRMKAAALSGLLFVEQPFVISRSAAEIDEAWDSQERVLVQGIIDAYFLKGTRSCWLITRRIVCAEGKSRSWLICITPSWRIMLRHFRE